MPENLLAIEVRKAANHQPPEHDRHKLRALTDPHLWFAYRIGVYLVLGRKNVVSDIYVGGVIDPPLAGWLAARLEGGRPGNGMKRLPAPAGSSPRLCALPGGRAGAHSPREHAGEMTLISEACRQCDFDQRLVGIEQQIGCPFNSSCQQPLMR